MEIPGNTPNTELAWTVQVDNVCTGVQQWRHFFLRLRVVNQKVLLLCYLAVVESILQYGLSAWFGKLSVQLKARITQLTKRAMESGSIPHSRLSVKKLSSERPRELFQTPPMSSTLSFVPQAEESLSEGSVVSRTPLSLSIKALNG